MERGVVRVARVAPSVSGNLRRKCFKRGRADYTCTWNPTTILMVSGAMIVHIKRCTAMATTLEKLCDATGMSEVDAELRLAAGERFRIHELMQPWPNGAAQFAYYAYVKRFINRQGDREYTTDRYSPRFQILHADGHLGFEGKKLTRCFDEFTHSHLTFGTCANGDPLTKLQTLKQITELVQSVVSLLPQGAAVRSKPDFGTEPVEHGACPKAQLTEAYLARARLSEAYLAAEPAWYFGVQTEASVVSLEYALPSGKSLQ